MGSFGDGVGSLLDTYTRCLTLLKDLMRGSMATKEQVRLGGSIRSSRSQVCDFYSSRVSESGYLFEKGDAKARSSLRRLVRRLRAVVDSIVRRFGKNEHASIDYQSLMSFSQGSGLEAIRTMSDLSERVSVRSSESKDKTRSQDHRKTAARRSTRSTRTSNSSRSTKRPKKGPEVSKPPATAQESRSRGSSKRRSYRKDNGHASSQQSLRSDADNLGRRKSTLTTSSDSTKLGEIRHGEHMKQAQATFPLWTYPREPAKLKKGRLFGLFAR